MSERPHSREKRVVDKKQSVEKKEFSKENNNQSILGVILNLLKRLFSK